MVGTQPAFPGDRCSAIDSDGALLMNRLKQDESSDDLPGRVKITVKETLRSARRLVVAVVGGTLLLIGGVMMVGPGPAMVVIPLALAILAAEFAWARRLLRRVKAQLPEQLGGRQKESEVADDRGKGQRDAAKMDRH